MSRANIVVMGNLGKDPEFVNKGDKSYVQFSVAVNIRGPDGEEEATSWFSVTAYRGAEAIAKHLKKGSYVIVGGSFKASYKAKDGTMKVGNYINADFVEFGPKNEPAIPF